MAVMKLTPPSSRTAGFDTSVLKMNSDATSCSNAGRSFAAAPDANSGLDPWCSRKPSALSSPKSGSMFLLRIDLGLSTPLISEICDILS